MERRDFAGVALGVAAAIACLVAVGEFVTDDAMITLRYSRNLAAGEGLVWNPGEDPVEGFSNLSHVLLGALALRLGLPALVTLQVVNLIAFLALPAFAYVLCVGQTGGSRAAGTAAALLVGLHPALAYWAWSGLETASYSLLLAAFIVLTVLPESRPHTGKVVATYAALLMTRPEALVIMVVVGGVGLGLQLLRREPDWISRNWRWLLSCLALTLLYFAWPK